MYSPPQTLHTSPYKFSTAVSNFLIASSWTISLLPSPYLWTQNRLLYFILGLWKQIEVTRRRLGYYSGCPSTGNPCFSKNILMDSVLCAAFVKNPLATFPHFRSFSSHLLTNDSQDFFMCHKISSTTKVNSLTFRHAINMSNPSDFEKHNRHGFEFWLGHICFLLLWSTWTLPLHGLVLSFKIICTKNDDASQVIILSEKLESLS